MTDPINDKFWIVFVRLRLLFLLFAILMGVCLRENLLSSERTHLGTFDARGHVLSS